MIISKVLLASVFTAVLSIFGWNTPSNVQNVSTTTKQEVQQLVATSDSLVENKVVLKIDKNKDKNSNLNIGKISIRAIVVNIDELGNKYGSLGLKFTQAKLSEVEQGLNRLNTFIKQSSYGKTKLQWTKSGVYELGGGVCSHTTYGEKVNDLIQRALEKDDLQSSIPDYSYYIILHPMPDCPDGQYWSFEGRGQFTTYTLNGRAVHLRGIHISDLSDEYLFHEFGHTLAYKTGTGIGHQDYLKCSIVTKDNEIDIPISSGCTHVYDWNDGIIPVFTIMSAKRGILSDYNVIEKEVIGWLTDSDIKLAKVGKYKLSPIEQTGAGLKALKIPISGTNSVVYVSFRQPLGYQYPSAPMNKPNGVILDISNGSIESFLLTNNTNFDLPLKLNTPYRIGNEGLFVTVNNISNNIASITISTSTQDKVEPTLTPTPSITKASIDQDSLVSHTDTITLSGYVYNEVQPFGVTVSDDGGKIWSSGNLVVNNNRWSSTISQKLRYGSYRVQVYSNNVSLTTGTLVVTSPTASCLLTADKSIYSLGETINYTWTSKNATYALWQQDVSGKDHLLFPADKLSTSGSQPITASVIGNLSTTLLVSNPNSNGSCTATITVSQ